MRSINPLRTSLLVRRLKPHTSTKYLRELFGKFGEVKDLYLPLNFHTKRPRGFGFVEYYNEVNALAALEALDRTEVDGSIVEITIAQHGRSSPGSMSGRERAINRGANSRNDNRSHRYERMRSYGSREKYVSPYSREKYDYNMKYSNCRYGRGVSNSRGISRSRDTYYPCEKNSHRSSVNKYSNSRERCSRRSSDKTDRSGRYDDKYDTCSRLKERSRISRYDRRSPSSGNRRDYNFSFHDDRDRKHDYEYYGKKDVDRYSNRDERMRHQRKDCSTENDRKRCRSPQVTSHGTDNRDYNDRLSCEKNKKSSKTFQRAEQQFNSPKNRRVDQIIDTSDASLCSQKGSDENCQPNYEDNNAQKSQNLDNSILHDDEIACNTEADENYDKIMSSNEDNDISKFSPRYRREKSASFSL